MSGVTSTQSVSAEGLVCYVRKSHEFDHERERQQQQCTGTLCTVVTKSLDVCRHLLSDDVGFVVENGQISYPDRMNLKRTSSRAERKRDLW